MKTALLVSIFPTRMFVSSLPWQNDRFVIKWLSTAFFVPLRLLLLQLPDHLKNRSLFEFSLWLSRACLGKKTIFSLNKVEKDAVFAHRVAHSSSSPCPDSGSGDSLLLRLPVVFQRSERLKSHREYILLPVLLLLPLLLLLPVLLLLLLPLPRLVLLLRLLRRRRCCRCRRWQALVVPQRTQPIGKDCLPLNPAGTALLYPPDRCII
jgi:hypothetical protein